MTVAEQQQAELTAAVAKIAAVATGADFAFYSEMLPPELARQLMLGRRC